MRGLYLLVFFAAASPCAAQVTYPPTDPSMVAKTIQTTIPPATAVTTADGSFAGTWQDASGNALVLTSAPTRGMATIFGNSVPYHCQLATLTTTGFTGKCWQIVSSTMPTVASALLGLVVSPIANTAAGLTVNVFARQ